MLNTKRGRIVNQENQIFEKAAADTLDSVSGGRGSLNARVL